MIYTSNRAEAIELSRAICRTMDRNLDIRIIGVKDGRFYVLKGCRMPAVLIEVGFLSNSNEERLLKNAYYRQQVAEAIFQGIKSYIKERALVRRK
jgi:N-acetylmuramoyl-L-alanine amidase